MVASLDGVWARLNAPNELGTYGTVEGQACSDAYLLPLTSGGSLEAVESTIADG